MTEYFDINNRWFKDKETEVIKKCINCGKELGEQQYNILIDRGLHIVTCPSCNFQWNYNQPTQGILNDFYAQSLPMTQWSMLKLSAKESIRQEERYQDIWEFIRIKEIKSILDVGCGNGLFLNRTDSKIEKVGIEPNQTYSDTCKFPVYKDYDHFKSSVHGNKTFQMVTLFGVLEHLKDPHAEIERYKNHLDDNGIIIVIVPNVKSLVVNLLGMECSTFCPQHLWYFDALTLVQFMTKHGMYMYDAYTIEAEEQPCIKKMIGLRPYKNYGIPFTHPDINAANILKNNAGYKVVGIFIKDEDE